MGTLHQTILYASLAFLGLSLTIPGLIETLRTTTGSAWLAGATV